MAIDFLEYPNPQDSFSDIMKPTLRDTIRYDAGSMGQVIHQRGIPVRTETLSWDRVLERD